MFIIDMREQMIMPQVRLLRGQQLLFDERPPSCEEEEDLKLKFQDEERKSNSDG